MASYNKITIVGYLGRDPELRYTPQGTAVCDFTMATSEKRRGRDGAEGEETTTWFRVSMWGRQAEVANQYLQKGRQVLIEGRLSQREYTDRDGNKRTSLEVFGTDMCFIGSRGEDAAAASNSGQGRSSNQPNRSEPAAKNDFVTDDDIPF